MPKELGRPVPSVLRCARHFTRGKPAKPLPLNASRALARPPVLISFGLHQVSRAYRLGAPGLCPPEFCRCVGATLAVGTASEYRLPPPLINRAGARCDSRGCGQIPLCPTPSLSDQRATLGHCLAASNCAPDANAYLAGNRIFGHLIVQRTYCFSLLPPD